MSWKDRLKVVHELRLLLVERRNEVCNAITADVQRTSGEIVAQELLPTAAAFEYLQRHAESILRPRHVNKSPGWLMGVKARIYRLPYGVIGVVGTWNYPLFLNAVPILQALVAGNTVAWKPSENTPRFAEVWTQLLRDAGICEKLVKVLPATRESGAKLLEEPINFLHFTGSEIVGRMIAARLGERLIPSTLELSGNDALFVLADADLKLAARSAWYGSTLNRGRTCMATRRVFVADVVAKEFLSELLIVQKTYNSTHPTTLLLQQPMNTAGFDPTLAVREFHTLEEASLLHSECPYRLTASIFSKNVEKHLVWAQQLGVGTITFNDVIVPTAHPSTPFPSAGDSGWGCTQGDEGLLAFTRPQVVSTRGGRFRPHIDTMLDSDTAGDDVTLGILLARHSRTWWGTIKGFQQMFRGFANFGKSTTPNRNPTIRAGRI